MSRMVIKPVGNIRPKPRFNFLGRTATQKLGTVLLVFGIILGLLSLVTSPLALVIAWVTFYRQRTTQWTGRWVLFLWLTSVIAFIPGAIYWYPAIVRMARVVPTFNLGTMLSTAGTNWWGLFVFSWAIGIPFGLVAAWWAWQRTPDYDLPTKKRTLFGESMMRHNMKKIEDGTYRSEGEIVYGVEDAAIETGDTVIQQMRDKLHTLYLGKSGAGKTQTMFREISAYIADKLPMFLIDMKGSKQTLETARAYAEAHGRPFYNFSLNGDWHYDPLGASDDPTRQRDLVIAAQKWSDEHYKSIAEEYLLMLFRILQITGTLVKPGGERTSKLESCAILLDPAKLLAHVQANLDGAAHAGLLAEAQAKAQNVMAKPDSISGLQAKLNNIVNTIAGTWIAPGERMFTLRQAWEEGAVVVFSLNYMNYETLSGTIGSFIMHDLKTMAGDIQSLPKAERKPWLIVGDEFTKIVAGAVDTMMQQVRESNARVSLSTQGISDILGAGERGGMGGEAYAGVIWGQADTIICHRVDTSTAKRFIEDAGLMWGVEIGHDTHERDGFTDTDNSQVADRGRVAYRKVERIDQDTLTGMSEGHFAMIGAMRAPADADDKFMDRALGRWVRKKVLLTHVHTIRDHIASAADDIGNTLVVKEGEVGSNVLQVLEPGVASVAAGSAAPVMMTSAPATPAHPVSSAGSVPGQGTQVAGGFAHVEPSQVDSPSQKSYFDNLTDGWED